MKQETICSHSLDNIPKVEWFYSNGTVGQLVVCHERRDEHFPLPGVQFLNLADSLEAVKYLTLYVMCP